MGGARRAIDTRRRHLRPRSAQRCPLAVKAPLRARVFASIQKGATRRAAALRYIAQNMDTSGTVNSEVARPRRKLGLYAAAALVVVVGIVALYTWVTLAFTYSEGERVGYVQKLSRKGWICPTWEGELAMVNIPGQPPQIFPFSVRSDEVANVLQQVAGSRVSLHYEQKKGVPSSCFGETEYFVTAATAGKN